MKNQTRCIQPFVMVAAILAIPGCASVQPGQSLDRRVVSVESEDSRVASIEQVTVYRTSTGSIIRGLVRKRFPTLGSVPGHIDVTLSDKQGKVIYQGTTPYSFNSLKSKTATFSINLLQAIEPGAHLTIRHDESEYRQDCVYKS